MTRKGSLAEFTPSGPSQIEARKGSLDALGMTGRGEGLGMTAQGEGLGMTG
jgi:hypothetical protein